MKHTITLRGRIALRHLCTLAAALCAIQTFANPFDDGMEHTITNDTDFGDILYVGSENPDNTLIITNDSKAHALNVIIGEFADSTNNALIVETGSLLVAGDSSTNGLATGGIVVGDAGDDSAITVNNASKLEGEYLYVGFGTNDNGKIELDGEGTEMNIAQDAYVGYAGSTNTVNIGDGAAMNIGGMLTVGSANGSNNHINVSGTLSVNSTNDINVVEEGNDNGITVKSSGTLQVGGAVDTGTLDDLGVDMQSKSTLELGGELTLAGNMLDSGHNVILNNTLSTNEANWSVDSGTFAHIGKTTSYNTLTFTNGATGSSSIGLRIGTEAFAGNNTLVIGGEGTKLTAERSILVGGAGSNNKLNITNGGELQVYETLTLGKESSSTGNEVNVGSNGVLSAGSDVIVGANGGNNTFNIDQGRVTTASSFIVGRDSDGNSLNIAGSNSLLNISQDLIVGDNGGNNTFNMDQGRVSITNNFILGSGSINNRYNQTGGTNTVAGEFIIGETEDATGVTTIGQTDTSGNLGSVGEGATLNIQQNLTVGREGGGSILLIHDGGAINVAGDAVIGEASDDNYIFLQPDDPDSRFNVAGDLVVSKDGENNRFAVYGGTATIDGNLYLGGSTNQHVKKNYIHLSSTNAVLNVAGAIHIGASNSVNTLNLHAGAKASAQDLLVGAYEGTTNNVVTITGRDDQGQLYVADSLLSVSNNLAIGSNTGSNNAVNIDDGGTLFVGGDITIGSSTNDLNNRLNVNSGGTLHTVDWDYATVSTNIVLNSGSSLELDGVFSGTNQLDGGIEVALNGTNAGWENIPTNKLYIGYETDGNTLTLENGAFTTTSTNLIVGNSSKSIGNTLSATGLSSRVTVGNNLIVGNKGSSGNALNILGGGEIAVTNNFILGASSDGNRSLLEGFEGTNSTLNVMGDLTVGLNGNWNELRLSSNAVATIDGRAIVGLRSNNNTLTLEGSNTAFNVGSNLVVGVGEATGNTLQILDGGKIDVANNFTLGAGGNGNTALLEGFTDAVSMLNVTNNLTIGAGGDGNIFSISSNATVQVLSKATIGSNGNNNELRLTGANASFIVESNLVVGVREATGNKLAITEGSAILNADLIIGSSEASTENDVFVSGTNSTMDIANDLYVGKEGSDNSLEISDGAFVDLGSAAYIGFGTNSLGNSITVSGSNSMFNVANNLYAGYGGDNNSLTISGGATTVVSSAYIGFASSNNWISITGSNSTLDVLNNMFVGNAETNISGNNAFYVLEAATARVGGDLSLSKGLLRIDADAQVVIDGNYDQDEFSTLALGISTNYAGTNLVVGGTASFAKNATIAVYDDETIAGTTNDFSRALVTSTSLVIDGQEATQILLNDSLTNIIDIANDLLDINLIVSNNSIWVDSITRLSLASTSGLEDGTQLASVADEIDFMADSGSNEVAETMRDIMDTEMDAAGRNKAFHDYYDEKVSSAPMHNVVNQGIGSIASELTVRSDTTRKRATAPVPFGAAGPHTWNQGLQGWIAGYGSWGDKSASDGFDAYDANLGGFVIGADLAISKNILVGLAGGSNSGSVDKDNGASGDTKTTYGAVYASAGTKDWFLDGSVIYGSSSIGNTLGDAFDTSADYDAMNLAFYLGGGKEIIGTYLIITPQASLLANYYEQDAYDEKSSDAVTRSVDGFDALYVQSSLGCNLGVYMTMGNVTLKPELRAHWLHEFNAKEEDLAYTLIGVGGSGTAYNMILQAPEEDVLRIGAGVSAKLSEYLELRADLDTQQASAYSDYTVSGSLRYQF